MVFRKIKETSMRKSACILLMILIICFLAACSSQTPEPTENPQTAPTLADAKNRGKLGEGIALGVGKTVWLPDVGIYITLLEISEDSRCPTTAECFIAGWVTAVILVEKEGEMGEEVLLSLGDPLPEQGSEALLDTVIVRLVQVTPYPGEPGIIPQEDYEVVLVVEGTGE